MCQQYLGAEREDTKKIGNKRQQQRNIKGEADKERGGGGREDYGRSEKERNETTGENDNERSSNLQ